MKIRFEPEGKCVEYHRTGQEEERMTVLDAARQAGVLIDASCHEKGVCGKCKVRIPEDFAGACSEVSGVETELLTAEELDAGWRLACRTYVQGDMTVYVPSLHGGTDRKKNMASLPEGFVPAPSIQKIFLKVKRPKMTDQRSDLERLEEGVLQELNKAAESDETAARPGDTCSLQTDDAVVMELHEAISQQKGKVTAVLRDGELFAVEAGDTTGAVYGLAVDIGTTTVVCMLWNLLDGQCVDVEARTNPQSLYGADVISRIQYTKEGEGHLRTLQDGIIGCINEMIRQMTARSGVESRNIYDCCVVGNTTMSHLFFGVNPESLARTPFAPVFTRGIKRKAGELAVQMHPQGWVEFLPDIAGHVGADITALLLAADLANRRENIVAIDIGTNGEVLCVKDGEILACSTAAGPAFEGAGIRCGMRAAPGAIERAKVVDGRLQLSVIEQTEPVGVCGSGVIDLVAALRQAGVINEKGRMLEREEALANGLPETLADCLRKTETGMEFVVWQKEGRDEIILSQNDVREIQLTKGAMLAGMKTLMKLSGMTEDSLDYLLIAGAFGNYIEKDSALAIRLLPSVAPEKILSIGNSAGVGASMALLNKACRDNAKQWVTQVKHVELSVNMDFQEEYMQAMNF